MTASRPWPVSSAQVRHCPAQCPNIVKNAGESTQSRNRAARSVWSAWSLLPLLNHLGLTTAPASWPHSKRIAWQVIHKNPRSLRTTSTIAVQRSRDARISAAGSAHLLGDVSRSFPGHLPAPCGFGDNSPPTRSVPSEARKSTTPAPLSRQSADHLGRLIAERALFGRHTQPP